MSRSELAAACKEKGIKGCATKKKGELLALLLESVISHVPPTVEPAKQVALSLFSGAGGDTFGLEAAGWTVSHYSEFNGPAIKTHGTMFPHSKLLTGPSESTDIKKIPDETFTALKGKVDLIFAGHPCFVSGTKVLTYGGYKSIEDVTLEDKLQTHTGKFQAIVNLQRKSCDGALVDVRLKYHPLTIRATDEHPFYVRPRTKHWDNAVRKYVYAFGTPEWKKLGEMTKDDFCGMVINTESIIPTRTIAVKRNTNRIDNVSITLDSKDAWFMMGYFIGDGWIQDTTKSNGRIAHTIRFAIADKDIKSVLPRIQNVLPITDKHVRTGSCSKFGCSDAIWFNILQDFGRYAHGKKIPEWVHSAPNELIQEFLEGYISADGCHRKRGDIRITTVSYNLAMSVQRLFLKLGKIASVQHTRRPPTHVICGRTVNQRDTYEVTLIPEKKKQHSGFIDGGFAWMAPAELSRTITEPCIVYNFEVAEDNSYIVENTVVHNCQGFSHAGKKRADDPRNELVHEFIRAARLVQPEWIIGENVKGLLSRNGVYPPNTAPRPVIQIIRDLFEAIGYKMTYRLIDTTEVGVPQVRKRLLYIGHRGDKFPHLPWEKLPRPAATPTIRHILTPTLEGAMPFPALYKPSEQPARFWIPTTETAPSGTPHPNLSRLVGGIRNLSTKEKTDLGHGPKETVPHEEPEGLVSFGVRKSSYHGQILDPDAPSKTIICTYNQCPRLFVGLYNATENKYWIRCLTPTECGQIQGFPADYAWQGTNKDKIIQIGNAVPPPLATAVANLIKLATLKDHSQVCDVPPPNTEDTDEEEE